jgi:hypothetical protein
MKVTDMSKKQVITILRFLYPAWALVGGFSIMYVPSALIVSGDATTTANKILARGLLFRLGIVGSLATQLIFIFVVLLLYKLFETVNKNQSLLMAIFALASVPIAMINSLNRIAALHLLENAEQLMFFLNLDVEGVYIAQIFWGLWLFPLGYLICKSEYFPKFLGVLVITAGFAYVLDSFTHFILPNYNAIISPILTILMMGEVLFMLWVMIRGAKIIDKT